VRGYLYARTTLKSYLRRTTTAYCRSLRRLEFNIRVTTWWNLTANEISPFQMNKHPKTRHARVGPAGALRIASLDNDWKRWITGKALPLSVWIFFLVVILVSAIADASRILHDGASLESLLLLARAGLTGAFMFLLATAYLIRIHATEKAQGFWERTFPLLVFLVSIAGMGLLHSRPGSPNFYLAVTGLLVAPPGLCLSIWSVWHLRGSFSILAEARRTVASGPYRYIRHPLYVGEIVTMLGVCLLIGTGIALLFWGVISVSQLARARIEEKKLSRALSDYEVYRRMTPFIFPDFLVRSR
jgi:protein-S-isoprenylcysteine O-methyltransferase Ste14